MVCRNCGNENMPGASTCARCGAYLGAPTPPPPYGAYPAYRAPEGMPGKGLGITSMIFGILSVVFFCLWPISITFSIVSLILGIIGKAVASSRGRNNGMALAGIICSVIVLAIYIIAIILVASDVRFAEEILEEIAYELR